VRRGAALCVTVSVLLAVALVPGPAAAAVAPVPRSLVAVTCPTPTRCFAVGYAETRPSYNGRTLVERWNGSSWSIMSSPNGSFRNTFLAGIACTSATSCIAVGHTRTNSYGGKSYIFRLTGDRWSAMATPQGDTGGRLQGVACTAATNCFAVGLYDSIGRLPPLAMHWNGAAWTKVDVALPPGLKGGYLAGVACVSGTCFAVGRTDDANNPNAAIIERWNGTKFVVDAQFSPSGGASPEFRSVTCPTATRCRAVGDDGSASARTLAALWTGATWSIESAKNRDTNNYLNGVSCWTASDCLAVGRTDNNRSGVQNTLSEVRRGSTWSVITSPNPDPRSSYLQGVDCIGPTRCFAVGTSTRPIILQWNGSHLSNVNSPA